jgi:RND family efflux transporter MFP subunit
MLRQRSLVISRFRNSITQSSSALFREARVFATLAMLAWSLSACSHSEAGAKTDSTRTSAASAAEADERGKSPSSEAAEKGVEGDREAGERSETAEKRVTLGADAFRTAGIVVELPRSESIGAASGGLEVPAQIEIDPARLAVISPRASGRLERLLAVPGQRVAAGETVALLYSPAYATAQNDLLQARRRSDLLAQTADAEGARALLDAARRRVAQLGASEAVIRRIEGGDASQPFLSIPAPFSGSIIENLALAGQAVEAGMPLYRLADLSVVNVAADVPERAIATVQVGQSATLKTAASSGSYLGRVSRIGEQVDPQSRTVKALIQVANRDRLLKPGMFASVTLSGGGTAARVPALSVPSSALTNEGAERFVFVEVGPRTYARRAVEVARTPISGAGPSSGRVAITRGLSAGDRVVTRGAFTLKSELAKASLKDVD